MQEEIQFGTVKNNDNRNEKKTIENKQEIFEGLEQLSKKYFRNDIL